MLSSRFPRCARSVIAFAEHDPSTSADVKSRHEPSGENPYEPPSLRSHRNDERGFLRALAWYVARGAIVGALVVFAAGSFALFPTLAWGGWEFGEFYVSFGERKLQLTEANATIGMTIFGAVIGLFHWCLSRKSEN